MLKRVMLLLALVPLTVACAGGHQYTVKNDDGSFYRVTDVGHTNLARTGAQYAMIELCVPEDGAVAYDVGPDGEMVKRSQCIQVGKSVLANPSLLQQLGGAASTVIAAELLRKGIEKSGDRVNATAEGGDGGSGGHNVNVGGFNCRGRCK